MKRKSLEVMMIAIIMLVAHSFAWGQNKKKLPRTKQPTVKPRFKTKVKKVNAKMIPFKIKDPENDAERRKQIRDGLRFIRRYDNPKLMLVDDNYFNEPPPPEYVMHRTGIYKYITQAHKIDKQEIYLKGEGLNEFYPGAMFYVDYNLAIGNPTVMSGIDRGKITLYGTFISDQKNTQNNVDISSSSVQDAIRRMAKTLFKNKNYKPATIASITTKEYTSKNHLAMELGINCKWKDLKVSMKTTKDKSSFVQATSLEQQYFTVKISDDWVEDISVLFGPDVTWKEISERLRNRPLAIVTSVTYGRSVHFLKEFSSESFNLKASQSGGSKAGNKMSFKQAIADSTSAKNYELINIGGSNTLNEILNSKDMSTEDIHKALSKSLAFSPSDQGVPVAYTICLITGENPGTKIKPLFDGVYYESNYQYCPKKVTVTHDIQVSHRGYCNFFKPYYSYNTIKIVNGKIVKVRGNGEWSYHDKGQWVLDNGRDDRVLGWHRNNGKDEYIDGNIQLRVRAKNCGGSYGNRMYRMFNPSSGRLYIKFRGSVNNMRIDKSSPSQPIN